MSTDEADETGKDEQADSPTVKDHAGPWDEVVNRIILLLLPLAVVVLPGYVLVTGQVRLDYSVTGEVPASLVFQKVVVPGLYLLGGIILVLYALALMKFYGSNPFTWVVARIRNAAADYNPDRNRE